MTLLSTPGRAQPQGFLVRLYPEDRPYGGRGHPACRPSDDHLCLVDQSPAYRRNGGSFCLPLFPVSLRPKMRRNYAHLDVYHDRLFEDFWSGFSDVSLGTYHLCLYPCPRHGPCPCSGPDPSPGRSVPSSGPVVGGRCEKTCGSRSASPI